MSRIRTLGKSNAGLFGPADHITIVTDGGVPAGVFLPFVGDEAARRAQARDLAYSPVYHITKLAKDILQHDE